MLTERKNQISRRRHFLVIRQVVIQQEKMEESWGDDIPGARVGLSQSSKEGQKDNS